MRVLASAAGETEAYPGLLAAIGESLSCAGALWLPSPRDSELRCAETWPAGAAAGAALAARRGRPAGRSAREGAFAFPLGAVGVMAFATAAPLEPDADLLATMESLGTQISQFVERCRAQQAVRASDARKSAILNAAFDCIITMDHEGGVIEVNRAAERTFGYSAAEMIGHELAELIIPPWLREAAPRRARALPADRASRGRRAPAGALAMRADGSEFPVEVIVTRADLPGPRDVLRLPARRHRDAGARARPAAAGGRAGGAAARGDRGGGGDRPAARVRRRHRGGRAAARRAELEHGALRRRHDGDRGRRLERGRRSATCRSATRCGWTATPPRRACTGPARPARIDDYDALDGSLAVHLRGLGFRCAVAAPIFLDGRLWGAVIVSSIDPEPFPAGAEQRIADFAELAAQALANADAREELAASRARIVAAGDAERRRLERNLHDGAQQRLVSLALMLRMAARRHPGDPDLVRAGEELTHALQELRELARGIHPAVLTERGLEPAVEALATRAPLPVELDVSLGDERLPGPVEAAAYYVVAEALTNVAKYAQRVGGHRRRASARTGTRASRSATTASAARPRRAARVCAGSRTASRRSAGASSSAAPQGGGNDAACRDPCAVTSRWS